MKTTILFVDDEVINLYVLEKRFQSDYNVIIAESAEEALEKINETKEELRAIISDMRMPGMDGLQFIEKVKQEKPDLPCFLLTGYDYSPKINEALASKTIIHLFKKPFEYQEIYSKLKEVI